MVRPLWYTGLLVGRQRPWPAGQRKCHRQPEAPASRLTQRASYHENSVWVFSQHRVCHRNPGLYGGIFPRVFPDLARHPRESASFRPTAERSTGIGRDEATVADQDNPLSPHSGQTARGPGPHADRPADCLCQVHCCSLYMYIVHAVACRCCRLYML